MHTVKLAVLPTPHTEQEAHNIALLLAVQLLHILVCTHVGLNRQPGKDVNNWNQSTFDS